MVLRLLMVLSLLTCAAGLGYISVEFLLPERQVDMKASDQVAPPVLVKVLMAADALPVATLLKDRDLVMREMAQETVPEGAFIDSDESRAELRGAMLRRYLDANTPILRSDILQLRDRGFLAAVLRPGTRAISVGVDAVTGAAGLIWPGDQVDLILTQEMGDGGGGQGRRVAGETILTDVRVIAVDQKIAEGRSDAEEERKAARTVTLEVSPEQAERVAVATRLGSISLVVRAADGPTFVASERPVPVYGADVSAALAVPPPAVPVRMRVIQGGDQQDVVFP